MPVFALFGDDLQNFTMPCLVEKSDFAFCEKAACNHLIKFLV
jgi:hypothetical protein